MILDIIIAAVLALMLIIGVRRGIARTLLNLLSVAVSGFLAYVSSKLLAGWIYSSYISTSVTKSVSETVQNSAQSADIISQEAVDNLPDFLVTILNALGITTQSISDSAASNHEAASQTIAQSVDSTISPVVTSVLSAILLVVLFVIFFLICRLLSRYIEKIFELPVLNSINRLLGGVLGLIEGAILIIVAILICRIILPFSAQPLITPLMIEQSVVFKAVYFSEFMNAVAGVISSGTNPADAASAAIAATEASSAS